MVRENWTSIVSFAISVGLSLIIWFFMPHDREVKNLGAFSFKLLPFLFASLSISTVKRSAIERYSFQCILVIASFLGFFCLLVPKIFFHYDDFEKLYYMMLVTTPYVILSLVMAYRLGGGSPEKSFRLSIAMLLLMLSGLEDLAYFTVNYSGPGWPQMPDTWDWVSHVGVFLGHAPSTQEICVFATIHVILAFTVLLFPFDKLFQQLKGKIVSLHNTLIASHDP
jgi:hypothetical protein